MFKKTSTNSADPDQIDPEGRVWSGSTMFASMHTITNNAIKYAQQMTKADNIFRCSFIFWRLWVTIPPQRLT